MDHSMRNIAIRSVACGAQLNRSTTMIFRLMSASRDAMRSDLHTAKLPAIGETVVVGESAHRALIRLAARGGRVDCPELTGQDYLGQPLCGAHRHAHVLPVDVDDDGLLDHVVIHARMGLGAIAQKAINQLGVLFGPGGKRWLHLQLVSSEFLERWFSRVSRHASVPGEVVGGGNAGSCDLQGSCDWISMTPFVPPRYLKKSGKNSLVGQVAAELASRDFPAADIVSLDGVEQRRMHGSACGSEHDRFVLRRHRDHAQPPQLIGFLVRLRFDWPVCGPICLGYASHFGLGMFRARGVA